jgi:CHAT domain-containing protein/tetratricopeptide (TPR) repeat protein
VRPIGRSLLVIAVLLLIGGDTPRLRAQPAASPARALAAASSVEQPLAAGDVQSYSIDLVSDQYVSLSVLQQGIDVGVTMFTPDARKAIDVDGPTGKYGTELLRLIAGTSGTYRIDVRSLEKGVPAGRYRLAVGDVHLATDDDRVRIRAQSAYLAGIGLRVRNTAESLRQAIAAYGEAARLWRSVDEVSDEGAAENDLAYVYRLLGEYQESFDHYHRALDRRRQAGDRPGEAQTLTNLGALSYLVGENQQALDDYERALPLRRDEGNFQEQALLLSNIGEVFALWSEHQQALDYFRQALPAERAVGDRLRESLTLSNIGLVYNATGQNREALEFFDDALTAVRTTGNRRVEARILANRGAAFRDLGDTAQALAAYEQALALQRAAGDRPGEGQTLSAIGVILMRRGDDQEALDRYAAALAIQRAIGSRRDEAATLNDMAVVLRRRGATELALSSLEQSVALRRAVQDRRGEAQSLYGLARVQHDRGDPRAALLSGDAAIEIVETLRTKLVSQEMRASYFATSLEMYEFVTATLMEIGAATHDRSYTTRAFQVSERARARALLDGLIEGQGRVRRGVSDELRVRERDLQDRINARADRQIQLLSGPHSAQDAERANREVDALLTELQELEAVIRTRSPRYAELTRPRPLDAAAVQRQVLDPETILLEYSLGAERSFLWVLTPDSVASVVLPPRDTVEAATRRFYALLTARNEQPAAETPLQRRRRLLAADGELGAAASALTRMLLEPIAARLAGKRLSIVADGALQYLPFSALPDPNAPDGAPLIVGHEIVLAPSASALAVLRNEHPATVRHRNTVAIIADPVFSADDPRLTRRESPPLDAASGDIRRSGAESGVSTFRRLRFSRDEAQTIAALTQPTARLEALDFRASRATAIATDLTPYAIVHFSTHGLLNTIHPELSGLVLSLYDEHGRPQDGFLRLDDIYNLALDADLVVLSACETALGREIRGEGLIGLARGFMYAGTSRVVASLWSVDDEATAGLMREFYRHMLTSGEPPAPALRAAQIALWRSKRWHAPYYWAAFELQGEWR